MRRNKALFVLLVLFLFTDTFAWANNTGQPSFPKNGSFFVFIHSTHIAHGIPTITADQVEMLGRSDIEKRPEVQAFILKEEGLSDVSEIDLPNDYYIYNGDPTLKTLTLSKKASFIDSLQKVCTGEIRIDRFSKLNKRHKEDLFKITTKNGLVVRIERVYLP